MSAMQLIFLIVSAVGLLAALGTVTARNLVHAALFLVGFFFSIACQFVLLEAEFLAAMQVLVYIGAVTILLLFGIMLTRNIQGDETTGGHWMRKVPAALITLGLLGVLLFGIRAEPGRRGQSAWTATASRPGGVNPTPGGPRSRAVAFAPTGQFIASADLDGRVRLWDPGSGRQMAALHDPVAEAQALAFSEAGDLIAAASADGRVRYWDVLNRRSAGRLIGGAPGEVTAIALAPPADRVGPGRLQRPVAVGGADGVVRLWGLGPLTRLDAHAGPVAAIRFDGRERLVTAGDDGSITRWELPSGRSTEVRRASTALETLAVAIGPAPESSRTEATEGEDATAARSPLPPRVAVAERPLDAGDVGWTLRVLDASDGREVASFDGLEGLPTALAIGTDGIRVAASLQNAPDDPEQGEASSNLRVWPIGAPVEEDPGVGPDEPIATAMPARADALAAGPRGRLIAAAGPSAPLGLYSTRSDRWAAIGSPAADTALVVADMPRAVGIELMTRYVIPFEVAGLLLTAALVGAIVLARQDAPRSPEVPGILAARSGAGAPTGPVPTNGDGSPDHATASPAARPSR